MNARLLVVMLSVGALTVALASPASAAPPRNDSYLNPAAIKRLPATKRLHSTADATLQAGEPIACFGGEGVDKTVWYAFTPPSSLSIQADTFGSDYDTVLVIYTWDGTSFTPVACNDDASSPQSAIFEQQLTGGTTYYFQIGGFGGASGRLLFTLQECSGVC